MPLIFVHEQKMTVIKQSRLIRDLFQGEQDYFQNMAVRRGE